MKHLILIVLLVAIIFTAGCFSKNQDTVVIPPKTPTPSTITLTPTTITPTPMITLLEKKCNNISFYPSRQSCCFGIILDGNWRENSSDGSCEGLNFEYYCGGVRSQSNRDFSCCNGTAYYERDKYCCDGKLYKTTEDRSSEGFLCNGKCYYTNTQSCYKGEIYDGKDRSCDDNYLCESGTQCCYVINRGPICYDPETQECVPIGSIRKSYYT